MIANTHFALTQKHRFPTALFDKVATTYDTVSALPRAVSKQLLTRLTDLDIQPTALLDLGCGTGHDLKILQKYYPKAQCVGVDQSGLMLNQARQLQNQWIKWKWWKKRPQWVCAQFHILPFRAHQFDLVYANLSLAWVLDFHHTLAELYRVLKPKGILIFSMLGPNTLKELTKLPTQLQRYPWSLRDMHDVGDALISEKFTRVVMEAEVFNLRYAHFYQFQTELQQLGFHTLFSDIVDIDSAPNGIHPTEDSFSTTWEIIYGHAWVPPATVIQPTSEISIPLSAIRRKRNHDV